MRLLAAVLCALALPVSVYGRSVAIEAVDSVSGDGVPYVAVYLTGTPRGALADEDGRARIEVPDHGVSRLELSAMGYEKKKFSGKSRSHSRQGANASGRCGS